MDEQDKLYSQRLKEEKRNAELEQGLVENVKTGFESTILSYGTKKVAEEGALLRDEKFPEVEPLPEDASPISKISNFGKEVAYQLGGAALALTGERAGDADYDKQKEEERLTAGIPLSMQQDIMEQDNLAAAERVRARILADQDRGERMAAQRGLSPWLANMVGSLADVDIPLTLMTGGGFKAAQVAGKTMRVAQKMKVSPSVALRVSSSTVGLNAGLQSGLALGIAEANFRDGQDWTVIAEVAMGNMALGAVAGAARPDWMVNLDAARQEFYHEVATNGPTMSSKPDIASSKPTNYHGPVVFDEDGVSTAGAKDIGFRAKDPLEAETPRYEDITSQSNAWRQETGWQDRKEQVAEDLVTKVGTHWSTNLTTSGYNKLYTSGSPTANWFAGAVFESANGLGRGRFTASSGTEMYQKMIFSPIANKVPTQMNAWAKRNQSSWAGTGFGISGAGKRQFNREVMLEMNDRAHGRVSTRDIEIQRAADAYEEAGQASLSIGKGRDGETAMDGFENIPDRRGYSPYVWDGATIQDILTSGRATRANIEDALSQSYKAAGMWAGKDARKVAKAVLTRALDRNNDVDTSMINLLSSDGRDFLRETLENNGTPKADVERIMEQVTATKEGASREGFTKNRNDLDLNYSVVTADGSELKLVDLMDNDMGGVWNRYSRRVAGGSALARVGITNRAQRKEFITAMQIEQRALGEEPIPFDEMDALLSNFNGGAVKGYSMGKVNEGQHPVIVQAKRATNLAYLNQLGVTQLAETGANIAATGAENWFNRSIKPIFDREMKAGNQELLDDLAFMTGEIGNDHKLFNPHLDLDDIGKGEAGEFMHGLNRIGSNLQFAQGYTSLFNQVRSWQQRTAALGMTDKIFRTIKSSIDEGTDLPEAFTRRMQSDLGLDSGDMRVLADMVKDGTIEFHTVNGKTFVNRLNSDKWDNEMAMVFGASMTRNINQIVQKSMAGEQDAWMQSGWASIMTHLKTFPLQALQKQAIRNLRVLDSQSLTSLTYGLGTAYLAIFMKDVISGNSGEDRAKRAFGYSNMTGFVPLAFDPLMSVVGLDDYRFNQYGPSESIIPPAITHAQEMYRAPGAVAKAVTGGDLDWQDTKAVKALPFMNAYGISRIFN